MSDVTAAPTSRRRVAAAVLAAGAGAAVLTACDKPLPEVTFQSGSRSVLISPVNYCFENDATSCRGEDRVNTLKANAGSVVQISVPRTVADQAWVVAAYTLTASGETQNLPEFGSALVRDNHFTRVVVPSNAAGTSYFLAVQEFRQSDQPTGTWRVQVDVVDA